MFLDEDPARRFLVADEVGLGKTLVARGLIGRIVEHLKGTCPRIDIVYICSNADIARQNVSRLNVTGRPAFVQSTRFTLLPLNVRSLQEKDLNFISFTPGTTFSHGQSTGIKLERHLLYDILRTRTGYSRKGLARLLKASAGPGWMEELKRPLQFDREIADNFVGKLEGEKKLATELAELISLFHDGRRCITPENDLQAKKLTSDLRRLLARCCITALEPDLIILDEFQRFKDLLDDSEGNQVADLARELFSYSEELRILLLSATPYKMYCRDDEGENHYDDFLQTMSFLLDDQSKLEGLKGNLKAFRSCLLSSDVDGDLERLEAAKGEIESSLRRVMCRTERVCASTRLDAMLREQMPSLELACRDLSDLRLVDGIAREVGESNVMEYWKSTPYLLNFMKDYILKRNLRERLEGNGSIRDGVAGIIRRQEGSLLAREDVAGYREIDPANPRLRLLLKETVEKGLWRLLWLPPSLPYWTSRDHPPANGLTKTLVFSGWNVVPDAISATLSYAVERLMVSGAEKECAYDELSDRFRRRLEFRGDPASPEREFLNFAGHITLALFFPSAFLSGLVDPLEFACAAGDLPAYAEVRARVAARIGERLRGFLPKDRSGKPDRDWYWRALVLLEREHDPGCRVWCEQRWGPARLGAASGEEAEEHVGLGRFLQSWLRAWEEGAPSGPPPEDLCEALADLALAGPAVCAMRSLRRVAPGLPWWDPVLRDAAVLVGEGLRKQFNAPEVAALLGARAHPYEEYWRLVLERCAQGNLQSVLDEQAHVLREHLGLMESTDQKIAGGVAAELHTALSLVTSSLRPDGFVISPEGVRMEPFSIRCHYALRYGQTRDEDKAMNRKEAVRSAFNSPFRPFVLASTSVGQEGLDFHVWCHSLTHWNLPANPVDLEQREGRVHRYKGHAVRKNIAARHGLEALTGRWRPGDDPWEILFEAARQEREAGSSDLIPYWIYEVEGGASIERRVLAMPFSRDECRYRRLQRSLALYRMVFGQPRQEDLLEYLMGRYDEVQARHLAEMLRIQIDPRCD
jgi:hypothetical protein